MWIPPGNYRLDSTITLTRPMGTIVEGAGRYRTNLNWAGAPGGSVFVLFNAREAVLRDFAVRGNASPDHKPANVIEMRGDTPDPALVWAPGGCQFENMFIGGGSPDMADYGVAFTYRGIPNNNDQDTFKSVTIYNCTEASAVWPSPNSKDNKFFGCAFIGGKRGIWNKHGSFIWTGGIMANHSMANIVVTVLGGNAIVTDLYSENSARLLYYDGGANSNMGTFTMRGVGFAANAELAGDGLGIVYRSNGALILQGCSFGSGRTRNVSVSW